MARIRVMPALALLVVVAAACAEAWRPDYYHPPTFTVTGKVQCQDCTKNWNAYAYNARPIPRSFPTLPIPPPSLALSSFFLADRKYLWLIYYTDRFS